MNLPDLISALSTTAVSDDSRPVEVAVVGEDGEILELLEIKSVSQIQGFVPVSGGRRQLQYRVAIVARRNQ